MRAVWSGTVRSTTRVDRTSGLPVEYRLTLYDDDQASCSCPSFFYQSVRNPEVRAGDKLRYRCKHLAEAFERQAAGTLGQSPLGDGPENPPGPAPRPTPGGPPVGRPEPDFPDDFPDDYQAPRIRR